MAIDGNLFESFPIADFEVPQDNCTVYMKRYWITHEGSVLRFIRTKAWQCNALKELVEQVVENNDVYKDCEIQFFDYLYIPKD